MIKIRNTVVILTFLSMCSGNAQMPNILFLPIDDLRPMLGCYGDEFAKTPNFDRLSKMGVTFDRAYCQQAVCNPSRASLLTGLRPDRLRIWDLYTDFRTKNPGVVTLPSHLRNAGYKTVNIGKTFHNVYPDSLSWDEMLYVDGFPFDPDAGYASDENLAIIEDRKRTLIDQGLDRRDQFGQWYIKAKAFEKADVSDEVYYDGAQTKMALKKLEELSKTQNPFFFSIGFYKPHLPFNAPQKYWDMYDPTELPLASFRSIPENAPPFAVHGDQELRFYLGHRDLGLPSDEPLSEERQRELIHAYYACISYVDAQLGKILDKLDALELTKKTIIVLWSDHGYKLGDYNSWCKQSNYEVDSRVPLMIAAPGMMQNKHCKSLSELVDIYPTLCDLAGIDKPKTLEGQSLVPWLINPEKNGQKTANSQFLIGRFLMKDKGIDEKMGYSIRTDNFRYTEWFKWTGKDEQEEFIAAELYDHVQDPNETINVFAFKEYQSKVKMLKKELRRQFESVPK